MPLESGPPRMPPGTPTSVGYATVTHSPIDISLHTTTQLAVHLQRAAPSAPDFQALLTQAMQHRDVDRGEELITVLLEHATGRPTAEMRHALLQAALQVAVSDVCGNSVDSSTGDQLEMHMKLVSQVLAKFAALPSSSPSHIDQLDLGKTSDSMFLHLRYASKFLRLYPSVCAPQARPEASPLRAALFNLFHKPSISSQKEAFEALRNAAQALESQELRTEIDRTANYSGAIWKAAGSSGNHDLQSAMVLLEPDLFSVPSNARKAVDNPAIKQVLREIPYHSQPRVSFCQLQQDLKLENKNNEVTFSGRNVNADKVVCRHLAIHRIETQARDPQGKFRLRNASRPDGKIKLNTDEEVRQYMRQHILADTEQKFNSLRENATENHLLCNADFGKALIRQFKGMEARMEQATEPEQERAEAIQHVLLTSHSHAMSLQLHIKEHENKKRQYVTELYDPNITFNHVRFAHTDLNALDRLKLKDLFNKHRMDERYYKTYYPEGHESSVMHVVGTSAQVISLINERSMLQGAGHRRKLHSGIDAKNISGGAICHLLSLGFADALQALTDTIKQTLKDGRLDLLEAKDDVGWPGLHKALNAGRSEAIRIFGGWLENVAEQKKLVDVLEAKNPAGYPGLFTALRKNQAAAIQAFGTLLGKVTEQTSLIHLLEAKGECGTLGLHEALRLGNVASVRAFGALLTTVQDEDARLHLLQAKNAAGSSGLQQAKYFTDGNQLEQLIAAFTDLVEQHIPTEEKRSELLEPCRKRRLTGPPHEDPR